MNTLMAIDPWKIFDEVLNPSGRVYKSMLARASGRFPPVNVFMDENAFVIDMELPGKTAQDVELSLDAQAVVIADKPAVNPESAETVRPAWSRRIELPYRVDADKANAKFVNGILRIELARNEATGMKRIAIV